MSTSDQFRTDPPRVADERDMYQAWLDFHRGTLLWKCAGLTDAQLKNPAVICSASASTAPPATEHVQLSQRREAAARYQRGARQGRESTNAATSTRGPV